MRLVVAVPLALAIALFLRGAWRLRRARRPGIGAGRLVAAAVGFTALAVALGDAMHALGHELFAGHMAQHLLLVSVAAPALLLADPFAATLWGLPPRARRALAAALTSGRPLRRALARLTHPAITWPLYVAVLWLWHLPGAYDAALRSGWLHDLEHALFFGTALLFWWPVLGPAPHVAPAPHPGVRVAYLVLGALQSGALGLLLAAQPAPLYATYAAGAPAWGLTGAEDQAWGGLLMWSVGAAVDMAAVLLVVSRVLATPAFLDRSVAVREN
ncbi:MAG TPA: cytochrome c oxidase assembly protein [Terriglobales bacterium]|nr:cytochrome c oxidase assembly protein [Terriglobales bacterium]